MKMAEKDFAEEFFLHVVKTKQAKKAKHEEKRIHKVRKKAVAKAKKKEKEIEKIKEKELKPEMKSTVNLSKPVIAPLPAEIEHVPEPPARLLMKPFEIPIPAPKPRLLQPPRFFEQEMKVKPVVDLGKLNNLITDPTVQAIQCDGSFMPVKIIRKGETINTNIELDEREINDIINKFAGQAGQDIKGPVFKASIQGLMISAVISDFVDKRFIITKK